MSQSRLVEIKHPEAVKANAYAMAIMESTKNDAKQFNPLIMFKLLVSHEEYLKFIAPRTMPAPDFINILYTLVEEQAEAGLIISPSLREVIDEHRKTMDKDPMNIILQQMLIRTAKEA